MMKYDKIFILGYHSYGNGYFTDYQAVRRMVWTVQNDGLLLEDDEDEE